ncbi:hypothetical protein CLPU_2c02810 [Gottschalkia purinilytica]|uniref:Uncharacterized protein n=1 Tax=Gottschalkia purinilytica TaxID=1503 RepID=A0A0L0WED5_GOTPU|nr:cyclic-di-AMP receptor [Gottschalkia purinilytica]KNF09829.1 hypothetical protein CLPU_2c02810 [Gottschalkia purinilytica]
MKLVITIIQDDDVTKLIDKLTENKFRVTKLASTGGFLRAGNTTLLIGVEKERLDELIKTIEEVCETREVIMDPPPLTEDSVFMTEPYKVQVGGATIIVLDVERYEKV